MIFAAVLAQFRLMSSKKTEMKPVTYRPNDAAEAAQLNEIAAAYGVSRSDLIRHSLAKLIDETKATGKLTLYPRAKKSNHKD